MMRDFSGTPQVTTKLNDVKKSLFDSKTWNNYNIGFDTRNCYIEIVEIKSKSQVWKG